MRAKLSIGSWAYLFNQENPTNDFHVVLHKLQDLGYDGVELGSFGVHPTPASHPTEADRQRLRKEVADIEQAIFGARRPCLADELEQHHEHRHGNHRNRCMPG